MMLFLTCYTYSLSIDCPSLLTFASGLGLQSSQPTIWTQLRSNCCTATGVTCVGQLVTSIDWNNCQLKGYINGTAIPSGVKKLYLWGNQLTFISSTLPTGLTIFDINQNSISGSVPLPLPSFLSVFVAYLNSLNGTIPSLPNSLTELHFGGNKMIGGVPLYYPSGLTYLYLNSNKLSGSITSSFPSTLINLDLNDNSFTGDLPLFPSSLQYVILGMGIGNNRFTGTLRLGNPQTIYINNNWIVDVIIQDTSALYECDLSNNPLLGNSNIVALSVCIKNGLYNAALLPKICGLRIQNPAKSLPRQLSMLSPAKYTDRTVELDS
jgi:hypothetical protein